VAPGATGGALASLVTAHSRIALVLGISSEHGREALGALAVHRGLGLVGDAIALSRDPPADLLWEKPAFGRAWVAQVHCRTRPALGTFRPGAAAGSGTTEAAPPPRVVAWPDAPPNGAVELQERSSAPASTTTAWGDLGRAEVVLVVGMGVGGPEGIEAVLRHIGPLHAALGATRKVVDAGWAPLGRQVGLTGRSLAPELAVLVGVGGSANHLVGLKRARRILAVNADPAAAVFAGVDAGIVGDWREVLPELTRRLVDSRGG
jgi:electron transfer flavoprotein alpha subunit